MPARHGISGQASSSRQCWLVLSPWPTITAVLWWIIGLAGLWLGLLGIAMAVGLARVLRSGAEIPEAYWRTLVDYRSANE